MKVYVEPTMCFIGNNEKAISSCRESQQYLAFYWFLRINIILSYYKSFRLGDNVGWASQKEEEICENEAGKLGAKWEF